MTAKTEQIQDESGETEFRRLHKSRIEEFNRLKAELETMRKENKRMESALEYVKARRADIDAGLAEYKRRSENVKARMSGLFTDLEGPDPVFEGSEEQRQEIVAELDDLASEWERLEKEDAALQKYIKEFLASSYIYSSLI